MVNVQVTSTLLNLECCACACQPLGPGPLTALHWHVHVQRAHVDHLIGLCGPQANGDLRIISTPGLLVCQARSPWVLDGGGVASARVCNVQHMSYCCA